MNGHSVLKILNFENKILSGSEAAITEKSQQLWLKPDITIPFKRLDFHPSIKGSLAQVSRDGSTLQETYL